jgi:hypothetical protein
LISSNNCFAQIDIKCEWNCAISTTLSRSPRNFIFGREAARPESRSRRSAPASSLFDDHHRAERVDGVLRHETAALGADAGR